MIPNNKKLLIFFFISLSSISAYSQTDINNCNAFKKGVFAYRDSATNTIREFRRTGKHQVETDKQTGVSIKYKIEWISACAYKLTQLYANTKDARKKNNSWLVYTIVATTANSYTYQCSCSNKNDVHGTVVKME
ncbi:MAG TPA: hypothetical protein VMZ03_09200 [Chitinophagaceae bacterium]|nr:hypothetical protein [Chitinophagaceae bacterium]